LVLRDSVPLARPTIVRRAAASTAAAGDEQMFKAGAKLVTEEAIDERIDAAVGRPRPLRYRHYRLHTRPTVNVSTSCYLPSKKQAIFIF